MSFLLKMGAVALAGGLMVSSTVALAQAADANPLGALARLDRDKDGKISAAEFGSGRGAVTKGMDTNGDKVFTTEEITAYYVKIAPLEDPKTPKRISGYTSADANKDGKVTVEELAALDLADFKVRDLNKDGFITVDELKK